MTDWHQPTDSRPPRAAATVPATAGIEGEYEPPVEGSVTLHAQNLLSKWGFRDGAILDDVLFDYLEPRQIRVDDDELLVWLVVKHLAPLVVPRVALYRMESSHNPIRAYSVDGEVVNDGSSDFKLKNESARAWIESVSVTLTFAQVEAAAVELLRDHGGVAPAKEFCIVSLSPIEEMSGAWPTDSTWGVSELISSAGWDLLDEEAFPKLYAEYDAWVRSRKGGYVPVWEERKDAVRAALSRGDFALSSWFVYNPDAFDTAFALFDPLEARKQP